jgi:teichuronic acid biosynthesis glycosyltransferase TuaC
VRVVTFTSLFPNTQQPNLGVFVCQRMLHFARRPGNEVIVVAPVPFFPSWLPFERWRAASSVPRKEQIQGLTVYHPRYLLIPKISMPFHGLLMFLASCRLMRLLCRHSAVDLLDAHYVFPDGFAAVLLGKLTGAPVVVSARGTDINLFPSFRTIRPMIRWTLRNAAGLIAVSRALKTTMVRLGIPPDKVEVIGNGVDIGRFEPLDRDAARRRLRLPENGRAIVSVGNLVPEKGLQFLISAIVEVKRDYSDLRLYVVGKGHLRRDLEELARKSGVAESVIFVGAQPNEELRLWFSAADLSCLVSSREGWPNVILESLACGTPVLATPVGGVPEILVSPELGLMVQQSTDAIAEGLRTALEKSWDREALVRYARGRTWDDVAAELENYFMRCVLPKPTVSQTQ